MRLLLGTHTFLWFSAGDARLSPLVRQLIEDLHNERLLSAASIWEIGIKVGTGKLTLADPIEQLLVNETSRNLIEILPISIAYVTHISSMPFHHRDPFDRMLAAQSLVENIPLLSVDAVFDSYGVDRRW